MIRTHEERFQRMLEESVLTQLPFHVANDLSGKYSNLEQRYNEYADKSKKHIDELNRQHALSEAEKDLLCLAIRLQQSLYVLRWDIDDEPTHRALVDFEKAVEATNKVLLELKEDTIQIPDHYFSRNITLIRRRESFAKSKKKLA